MKLASKASCIALLMLGGLTASPAWAGCYELSGKQAAAWHDDPEPVNAGSLFRQASYASQGANSIVGMWSFKFIANGTTVDWGYTQWHADGTEFLNSGGRAPATQNYCMGVWTQVAPGKYHLNHYALSYDSTGALNAKVKIKEDVTLAASGATYSGTFGIDVYDPTTNALLQHVGGQVTAERVAAY